MRSIIRIHAVRIALFSVMTLSCTESWAARDFTPQAGTWVISEELDGRPGRGLAIDVQGNTFFMQVFGYERNGDATFYTATGQMHGNSVTAPLMQYWGGRSFGGNARDAAEAGSPGSVTVSFSNGLQGTVQFPGEPERSIKRFQVRSAEYEQRYWVTKRSRSFLVAPIDTEQKTNFLAELTIGISGVPGMGWEMLLLKSVGGGWQSLRCEKEAESDSFSCKRHINTEPGDVAEVRLNIANIDAYGSIDIQKNDVVTRYPLHGIALGGGGELSITGCGLYEDVYVADINNCTQVTTPSSGTWIVEDELQGKPGRGFAIDVQNGVALALAFNYLPNGAPTFHMGSANYQGIETSIALNQYAGGRWLGGPVANANLVGTAGEMSIRFSQNAEPQGFDAERLVGIAQIPGEPAKRIVRMGLETSVLSLDGLLGQWLTTFMSKSGYPRETKLVNLTRVEGDTVVSDDGTIRCARVAPEHTWRHVECSWEREASEVWSASFFQETNNRGYNVLQMRDRHGNATGLGNVPIE